MKQRSRENRRPLAIFSGGSAPFPSVLAAPGPANPCASVGGEAPAGCPWWDKAIRHTVTPPGNTRTKFWPFRGQWQIFHLLQQGQNFARGACRCSERCPKALQITMPSLSTFRISFCLAAPCCSLRISRPHLPWRNSSWVANVWLVSHG